MKSKILAATLAAFSFTATADELVAPVFSKYYGEHTDRFNDNTFGLGVNVDTIYKNWSVTGGTYRNAFDRQSNWLAMGYRAKVARIVNVGADFGAVSGYGKNRPGAYNGIIPSIIPVVGIRAKNGYGIDAALLPPVSSDTTWMVNFRLVAPL